MLNFALSCIIIHNTLAFYGLHKTLIHAYLVKAFKYKIGERYSFSLIEDRATDAFHRKYQQWTHKYACVNKINKNI